MSTPTAKLHFLISSWENLANPNFRGVAAFADMLTLGRSMPLLDAGMPSFGGLPISLSRMAGALRFSFALIRLNPSY
jgi:hypothetical protein